MLGIRWGVGGEVGLGGGGGVPLLSIIIRLLSLACCCLHGLSISGAALDDAAVNSTCRSQDGAIKNQTRGIRRALSMRISARPLGAERVPG